MTAPGSPDGDAVVIDGVTIRSHTHGDGPPVVFVHGVYVGGALWDSSSPSTGGCAHPHPT